MAVRLTSGSEFPQPLKGPEADGSYAPVDIRDTELAAQALTRDNPSAITVFVVDDHDRFRTGLKTLLTDYGFEVVGDAADGESAVALVESTAPDVVLMDLQLPRISGLEATRRIVASSPASAVLMLTVSAEEADVVEALVAGASGYLVKGTSPETVVAGIHAAARGETLMSAEVASRVFARLRSDGARRPLGGRGADLVSLDSRARDLAPPGERQGQRGDRARARDQSVHSPKPRLGTPAETAGPQPDAGSCLRGPARPLAALESALLVEQRRTGW